MSSEVTRSREGVPQWDGDAGKYQEYEELALQWEQSIPYHKRCLAGPRLVAELSGPARKHVTGKRPEWISYDGGVTHLLRHLRSCLGRPTIPEMTDYLNKYFRASRRKRFETMNHYITRKTEVYHRARQSLSRIQRHYARPSSSQQWSYQGWQQGQWYGHQRWHASSWNQTEQPETSEVGEEDDDDNERWYDPPSEPHDQWASWRRSSSYVASEDEPWKLNTEELLPEFLQGWYLLSDAGLDGTERNMIQTALREDYSVHRVATELRLQWPDEDLRRRDQQAKQSGFWHDEPDMDPDDDDDGNHDEDQGLHIEDLTDEGQALFGETEKEIQEAYAMIQQGRRTLKEVRSRQHQLRLNRQYYRAPFQKDRGGAQHNRAGGDRCLKCGKNHRTQDCPERARQSENKDKGQGAHFVCFTEESAMATQEATTSRTTKEAVRDGYAVIDGGATKTLGSVTAIQAVLDLNERKYGETRLQEVDLDNKPTFGFGNSSQDQCISTANLRVVANERPGALQIHALDRGEGPILFSVQTLRRLKAIIDFEQDLMVLRGLDDSKVIKLERSAAGHQLLPLTEDLFKHARSCKGKIPSLASFI